MKTSTHIHYQQRMKALIELKNLQKKKLKKILLGRIVSFLIILCFITLALSTNQSNFLFGVIPFLLIFGFLVQKNRKENEKLLLIEKKIETNQEEVQALDGNYSSFQNGKEFVNSSHEFTHDLDIFGEKSLFQTINRTSSSASASKLAKILSQPFTSEKRILNRQRAIQELKEKPIWREEFRAKGKLYFTEKKSIDLLTSWKNQEIALFENETIWRLLFVFIPVVMTLSIILAYYAMIPWLFELLLALIPLGITGRHLKIINTQHVKISTFLPLLNQHTLLVAEIENEIFSSEILLDIQSTLFSDNSAASQKIAELAQLANQFDNRSNPIFALLSNSLFLWDLRYLFRLKKWLKKNEHELPKWFKATHEIESYASFATFWFNNPNFSLPQISKEVLLKSQELAHPLMHSRNRIANDFDIQNLQEFVIITGANMAGKSTFLRAIGVNLVLANCGAPVCAKQFVFRPTPLYSSMRTTDSLSNNESYFYSELKRLQSIVDKLKKGETLFVILDEILKGTNSKDKAEGSKKFIKQLLTHQAAGIIATHDLSLCAVKEEFPDHIENKYFDVEIEQDQLVFDYTLKEGICSNMNAEFLMKKMGITE